MSGESNERTVDALLGDQHATCIAGTRGLVNFRHHRVLSLLDACMPERGLLPLTDKSALQSTVPMPLMRSLESDQPRSRPNAALALWCRKYGHDSVRMSSLESSSKIRS